MQAAIRRTRFRVLIALAAVAVPLVAAGSAQAAMARSQSGHDRRFGPTCARRRSPAFNSTTGATTIQVCFDKQIGSTPNASRVPRRQLPAGEVPADSASRDANGSCANVVWSSQFIDPQQRTYIQLGTLWMAMVAVTAGATRNSRSSVRGRERRERLLQPAATRWRSTDRASHNGTRGHTTAPDSLEGSRSTRRRTPSTTRWTRPLGGLGSPPACSR